MPPKKSKTVSSKTAETNEEVLASDSSVNLGKNGKPKKPKPLTKKEKEKMKKLERELKEALVQLKKEADQALAEFKALEEAAEKKAKTELFEHNQRTELLAGTCEIFSTAKSRLLHENNKLRESEIWERYITTDRMPYPENVPNMHDHLYLWQNDKSTEYLEFALGKCNSYVDTLKKLDELIEYPLYSTKEAVNNWKELRREWREEFLYKLDKACFNMIKNLAKNFKQDSNQSDVYMFDMEEEHVNVSMCAYVEDKSAPAQQQLLKLSPKISFPVANVHIVMPAAYRANPFILRLIHLDQDFFSESSLTYYCPESIPMEPDLLSEIHRCFDAKKEAKSLMSDREREKVRQAKLKVAEIQAAAKQAEKSFKTFQLQAVETSKAKKRESKTSLSDTKLEKIEHMREPTKKKVRTDVVTVVTHASDASVFGLGGGSKRPKGLLDDEGDNLSKSLFQSVGTQRALDAISMKSGMRKKQDRSKKIEQSSSVIEPESITHNIFHTPSMVSLSQRLTKVVIHRASELCFEAEGSDSKMNISRLNDSDAESFDSLDLMFGTADEEEFQKVRPLRQLVNETVFVDRDTSKRAISRMGTSISYDSKRGRRARGRSTHATLKVKGPGEEADEAPQSASEIFETNEDNRQEQYMSSLLFQEIPYKRIQLNLREYSVIGGTYLLDIIFHESQPRKLHNGNTVQIFYGEMNIKRDAYTYDYKPPPQPNCDNPEPVIDPGLQHLLHVKLSLPTGIVFFEAPLIALWDRELKFWTQEHVHKLAIDLESRSVSFSIDRVWPFAFIMKKYHLLPFASWNMSPIDSGGVTLALECKKASFEFEVVGFQVCLRSAVTSDGGAMLSLSDIIGEFMHLHRLIDVMKSKGLNIFPDEDAFLYIQHANSKDVVLEDHTYLSMAMFANSLDFLSSDLNADPKRQKLAFRVREGLMYDLELRYRTVVATSLSAQMYRIGLEEVSIDDTRLENLGFCPDVYSLLEKSFAHVSPGSPPNPVQILAVYALLSRTKVLSYCVSGKTDVSTNSSTGSKWGIKKKKKARSKAPKKSLLSHSSSNRSVSLIMSSASVIT